MKQHFSNTARQLEDIWDKVPEDHQELSYGWQKWAKRHEAKHPSVWTNQLHSIWTKSQMERHWRK